MKKIFRFALAGDECAAPGAHALPPARPAPALAAIREARAAAHGHGEDEQPMRTRHLAT